MRNFVIAAGLVLFIAAFPARADLPPAETRKIEALIKHVEGLRDAVFVRNGSEYDARSAAKFLRAKWEANAKEINSAQDFIDKAGSMSSNSGKPYLIRFQGGKEVKSGDYLAEQLKKLPPEANR